MSISTEFCLTLICKRSTEVKKYLDNLTFLIAAEEKETPSYLHMKLIVNYTHSLLIFSFVSFFS